MNDNLFRLSSKNTLKDSWGKGLRNVRGPNAENAENSENADGENAENAENAHVKKAWLRDQDMIQGRIFSDLIRIQSQKSELQAKSRSCGPGGQTPSIRTESPRKGPRERGLGASTENPP